MKILIIILTGLAALAAVAFAFNYEADRPEARQGPPSGPRARITCFSGGEPILDDFVAGNVNVTDNYGYTYTSRTTGRRIRTSGDCVIVYGAKPAEGFKSLLP
jgi:hypothetical protein